MWRALVLHRLSQHRLELEPVWNEHIRTRSGAERAEWNQNQHRTNRLKLVPVQDEPGMFGTPGI